MYNRAGRAAPVEKVWSLLSDREIVQFVSCPRNGDFEARLMTDIRFDEAFDILVERITAISKVLSGPTAQQVRRNASGSDVLISNIIDEYWHRHSPQTTIGDSDCPPFYDAAWELARIGVLRPGRHNYSKQHFQSGGFDGASLPIRLTPIPTRFSVGYGYVGP